MNNITLTASMRSNLGSLKKIQSQMNKTQERLSSGKKVNSAIDNASSYYQARTLTNRATDLNALLDSMGQGIQTIQAANEGIESATAFLEQMKSVANQASAQAAAANGKIVPVDNSLTFHDLWDGKNNTQKILAALNANGGTLYAAKAASEYWVVAEDDAVFGKEKWYLPSSGELMDLYGYNYGDINESTGDSGADGGNKTKINNALSFLNSHGVATEQLADDYYWSSSEYSAGSSWEFYMDDGYRSNTGKNYQDRVRGFLLLENKFDGNIAEGNILYSDLSYSSVDNYDNSKTVVGVVAWTSDSGASAKIVSLKDVSSGISWGGAGTDIPGLTNYNDSAALLNIYEGVANGTIDKATATVEEEVIGTLADLSSYQTQFNTILTEYDKLIADTSYQGVNLLNGGSLTITFNEGRTHNYTVTGFDTTASGLGVDSADWRVLTDVEASIVALDNAISTMRSYAEILGTSYSIIETRQNFTDALVNVLETGADELTLADMNEESANYLALQTRQQLAINSLSLASLSAQNVLKLF